MPGWQTMFDSVKNEDFMIVSVAMDGDVEAMVLGALDEIGAG